MLRWTTLGNSGVGEVEMGPSGQSAAVIRRRRREVCSPKPLHGLDRLSVTLASTWSEALQPRSHFDHYQLAAPRTGSRIATGYAVGRFTDSFGERVARGWLALP